MPDPSPNSSIDPAPTGRRILLARSGLAVGIVLCWVIYVTHLPWYWELLVAWYGSPEWQSARSLLGFTPQLIVGYIVALQIATVVSSTAMAALIGWRKSQDNLVVVSSFVLVVF